MRLSEQLSYSINKGKWLVTRSALRPRGIRISGRWLRIFLLNIICCSLFIASRFYAQENITIQLDEKSPVVAASKENIQPPPKAEVAKSPKELKKEIKALYSEAEKNRKKKRFLYAVQKYKEILTKDPFHKKAKARLSNIYSDTKIKIEDRVFTRSEEAYYAQSILFYTNNDLTGALNEWGKYLAIDPQNEEVRDFYTTIKDQLTEEYNRKKQEELEGKIKKLLEDGIDYFNAMKYKEAADRFRSILNMSPGHVQAGYYLDQINTITAKTAPVRTKTIIITEAAPKVDYEKANEFYNQGLQEYAAGHLREAIELWKKCLKYNPNHDKAKSNITKAQATIDGK